MDRSPNNCIVMERQEISAAAGIKQVYGKRSRINYGDLIDDFFPQKNYSCPHHIVQAVANIVRDEIT